MSLALGIDVGTSGVRTAVVDQSGELLGMERVAHAPQRDDRLDAELWWQAVKSCIRKQVAALRDSGIDPKDIATVSVDGTSGTMVLTDESLAPVGRALMYNSKGFEREADKIAEHAPESHITQGSGSALGRAMRLVSEAHTGTARHLLHQADYISAKLIGEGGKSDYNNALKTGFDPAVERWPDWLDHVIPLGLLPDPLPVGKPLGIVQEEVCKELGLPQGCVVHAGTTDSIAAFLAACPLEDGNAVTSIGSTLAIKLLSRTRIDDPAIGLYAHRLGDIWLVGGASNTGGAVLSHFFSVEEIERLSGLVDVTRDSGLDYYPLLNPGERFPINDPNLAPRLSPRPDDDAIFLQGLMEGMASIEQRSYLAMQDKGAAYPKQIFTAGGAAKNDAFTSIRQKYLGAPLQNARYAEAAIGAAYCARLFAAK